MNNQRRKRLNDAETIIQRALELLSDAKAIIDEVKDEEDEAIGNLPDSLRDGERGQRMQEAADALDEASSALDVDLEGEVIGALDRAREA